MLYLTKLPPKEGQALPRIIGYVLINGGAVKVVEAQDMNDIHHYVKERGYKGFQWRVPNYHKYQMIRVKEW